MAIFHSFFLFTRGYPIACRLNIPRQTLWFSFTVWSWESPISRGPTHLPNPFCQGRTVNLPEGIGGFSINGATPKWMLFLMEKHGEKKIDDWGYHYFRKKMRSHRTRLAYHSRASGAAPWRWRAQEHSAVCVCDVYRKRDGISMCVYLYICVCVLFFLYNLIYLWNIRIVCYIKCNKSANENHTPISHHQWSLVTFCFRINSENLTSLSPVLRAVHNHMWLGLFPAVQ